MKSILKAKDNVVLNNLPILRNDEIGELVREFNLIQKNNNNQIYRINKAKNMMIEQERLASLGQMIGGIAHNLKTPIFSISGANMALSELTNELSKSIDDERVDKNDYREIAKEMKEWNKKIDTYLEYMSDIITAVKGQTTVFANDLKEYIVISDIFKTIKVLRDHEMQKEMIEFVIPGTERKLVIDINSARENCLVDIFVSSLDETVEDALVHIDNFDNKDQLLTAVYLEDDEPVDIFRKDI